MKDSSGGHFIELASKYYLNKWTKHMNSRDKNKVFKLNTILPIDEILKLKEDVPAIKS